MAQIGIGVIGGGYMGKAHAIAHSAVGAIFQTALRPRLVSIAGSTPESGARHARAFGFEKGAENWRAVVDDPEVGAVVIAAPQSTHRAIAEAALALGKPVFCEKPLGAALEDSRAMVAAAEQASVVNMSGFNYIRTPASQFARQLLAEGAIGTPTFFRGEHTEDFLADPTAPATWRSRGRANGCMGDLSPHMINAARALMGPIAALSAQIETVHPERCGVAVDNDDQGQMMVRFDSGVTGHLMFSRVATGRKMGYAYEIHGTAGAIRFDGEDQNALWLYEMSGPHETRGFRKILTGPDHPDYLPFCQGPGHGTGYLDQIIIEAKDFLEAIHAGHSKWPDFREGMEVNRVVEAAFASNDTGTWVKVADF
ncbi:Gfo/Idh/MocA family protein [Oceaniglobus trochenteri]|uniref:Gfo/Idh/MocA family protein n=1 Tax=Oceaniglobus trochenteri TaxID=2763260 RepID=UPI001CFFFBE3|nr:Gfo/Idh/MocA family oxidoreductase [Oceaniglobus trochenteri]